MNNCNLYCNLAKHLNLTFTIKTLKKYFKKNKLNFYNSIINADLFGRWLSTSQMNGPLL